MTSDHDAVISHQVPVSNFPRTDTKNSCLLFTLSDNPTIVLLFASETLNQFKNKLRMTPLYKLSLAAILFVGYALANPIVAQTTIDWQKSIGTPNLDAALKIFNDEDGNFVIMGTETHVD